METDVGDHAPDQMGFLDVGQQFAAVEEVVLVASFFEQVERTKRVARSLDEENWRL